MMKTKLPILLLPLLLTATLASSAAPAHAGFTGDIPAIVLKNSTGTLPPDNPFYMTTLLDILTVGQKDSPTDPNWLWYETFELIAQPEPDFFKFELSLQHEIVKGLPFGFTLEGTMINEAGISVGPCNAQNEGEPIPEHPIPDFIPIYIFEQAPDLTITHFKIVAYKNPPYVVGEGRAWLGILAEVDVDPDTLNLASNGLYVTAFVTLPPEYDVNDIDVGSVRCNELITVPVGLPPVGCPCEGNTIGFKFFRADVQDFYQTTDADDDTGKFRDETVVISGTLIDGTLFAGVDTIRIIDKG